jgi:hypothetical protein
MRNDVPTMQIGADGASAVLGRVRWSPIAWVWWLCVVRTLPLRGVTHRRRAHGAAHASLDERRLRTLNC